VTIALLAGALFGLGLFLTVRGLRPAPTVARVAASGNIAVDPASGGSGLLDGVGADLRRAAGAVGLDPQRRCAADFAVTGRTAESHAARSLLAGICLAAIVMAVGAGLTASGATVPAPVLLAAVVVGLFAGPVLAELTLRAEAAERRDELRVDLGTFSELMVLLLAAGSGVESALASAAQAGDDWTWRRLHDGLRAARLTRRTPAEVLCELGRDLGVTQLEELGAAVALAASSGSRLRESLSARAAALRSRELARTQAEAASATERMTFPVVALAVGFLVVLGYPALAKVATGF
jgi:Flp pilus assembly protein TadB